MKSKLTTSAELCPLCGDNNLCGKFTNTSNNESCWCSDSDLNFTDELLEKVPQNAINQACICQACVMRSQLQGNS